MYEISVSEWTQNEKQLGSEERLRSLIEELVIPRDLIT